MNPSMFRTSITKHEVLDIRKLQMFFTHQENSNSSSKETESVVSMQSSTFAFCWQITDIVTYVLLSVTKMLKRIFLLLSISF